ncbi:MAG: DNA polymerase III subunit gamma/tau [Thermoanaerobaculia bacterium]
MTYQALARKYRPQTFSDIIGQETVVRTLQNAIEQNRIHHAYLFAGVRGIGKTTLARILAKALNCTKGPAMEPDNTCSICSEITEGIDMDVREIDAATYTGVDNIRDLRDVTQFQPARDRYRIFIIDEAHMLSTPAWNALLKILEEPPPHVVFMFATTEIQKLLPTILSRVQKFMLRKITLDELIGRLADICKREGIQADREALAIVARRGEGSVRDALSILDQVIAFSGRAITAADVAAVLGLSDSAFFARIVDLIAEGDHAAILQAIQEASESGRDFKILYRDLLGFIRNLLLLAGGADSALTGATPDDLALMQSQAGRFSYTELLRIANLLLRDDEIVTKAEHQRLAVEIALLKAATFPRLRSVEEALSGTKTVERPASAPAKKRAGEGAGAPPRSSSVPPAGDIAALLARIRKTKPLLAGYLEQASASKMDGDRIVWTFADPFTADSVRGSQKTLEDLAAEVFDRKIAIEIGTTEAKAEDKKAQPSLRDDPVVKAFQNHLGGEVVDTRKGRRSE